MSVKKYLLTDVEHVDKNETFKGLFSNTFKVVKQATFVDADTYERITLTDKAEMKKYIPKVLDNILWRECEIELRQCVVCNGFKPYYEQPYEDDCEYEDWINFYGAIGNEEEVKSGVIHVYFDVFSLEYHSADKLCSSGNNCSLLRPLSYAIESGLMELKGDSFEVPILRDDILWVEDLFDDEDDEDGIFYRDENSTKEGHHYCKDDFLFDEDGSDEHNTILGTMQYKVVDKGRFAKVVLKYWKTMATS